MPTWTSRTCNDAVNVNNRAQLAISRLPAEVSQQGVSVRTRSPDFLFAIGFYSPDGSLGALEITNFASTDVVDTIARVAGVGEAPIMGASEYSMRIWTDPDQGDDTRYRMGPSRGGHGFEARGRIGGLTRDRVACSASHQARTCARRDR